MRLYLSSLHFGDRIDLLLAMVGQGARVGVVSNALDAIPAAARESHARTSHDPVAELGGHGLDAAELDLRAFFGRPEALAEKLATLDLIWVAGGNAFLLRRAMRQSGFDRVAPDLIRAGKLVYGGWSAGAVVAGPDLRGIELMDDPDETAEGYDPAVVRDGLGLIPLHLVPHCDCASPDAEAAMRVTAYLLDEGLPYRTLRDGDVLIRDAAGIRAHERAGSD